MTREPLVIQNPGHRRQGSKHKKCKLILLPSRSDLVVHSYRFDVLVGNHEILNLSMVSGPVLEQVIKNKRKNVGPFILVGSKKRKKKDWGKQRNRSSFGFQSFRPDQKDPQDRR